MWLDRIVATVARADNAAVARWAVLAAGAALAVAGAALLTAGAAAALLITVGGLVVAAAAIATRAVRGRREQGAAADADAAAAQPMDAAEERDARDELERRVHALEGRNRELAVVNALAFAFGETMADRDATGDAERLIAALLRMDWVQIYRLPSDGRPVQTTLVLSEHVASTGETRTGLGEALLRQVAERGTPLFSLQANGEAFGVVPLLSRGEPFGALAVGGRREEWPHAERRLLTVIGNELAVALENRDRYRTAVEQAAEEAALNAAQQRRITELSSLAQIAEIMQSTVDPDRLFAGFARELSGLVAFEALYFAAFDEAGDVSSVRAFSADGRPRPGVTATREESAHPLMKVRSIAVWNAAEQPAPGFVRPPMDYGVVVAVRPKAQALGVLLLTAHEPLTHEDASLVERAAGQLGLALDSISLYGQATERAARIEVLGNIARIVASTVDTRAGFAAFAEEVRWLLPFDQAIVSMVDIARDRGSTYAAYPDGELVGKRWQLSGSLAELAIEAGRAVGVRRGDAEHADAPTWRIIDASVTEVACVPIYRGDECIAVLGVLGSGEARYTDEQLAVLEEVSRLLAICIERAELFERVAHSARHDLLTGLPNYRYLQERLREVRAGMSAPGATAVLMLDLDDLKMFNDTLGHAVGDQVVQIIARELTTACRADDFIARVGGDEFVVVMEGADTEAALAAGERLHEALRDAHLEIPGAPTNIRISIGVASAPQDAATVEDLLHAADQAMYEAKYGGGARTQAAGRANGGVTRSLRGRPNRVVEAVLRALTSGATDREREAVSLAERYATTAALRRGVPSDTTPLLRMLVARSAAGRLSAAPTGRDRQLAYRIVDGLHAQWTQDAPEAGGDATALAGAAVELAWLQLPPPSGEAASLTTALRRLREARAGDVDAALLDELEAAAKSQAFERRRAAEAA